MDLVTTKPDFTLSLSNLDGVDLRQIGSALGKLDVDLSVGHGGREGFVDRCERTWCRRHDVEVAELCDSVDGGIEHPSLGGTIDILGKLQNHIISSIGDIKGISEQTISQSLVQSRVWGVSNGLGCARKIPSSESRVRTPNISSNVGVSRATSVYPYWDKSSHRNCVSPTSHGTGSKAGGSSDSVDRYRSSTYADRSAVDWGTCRRGATVRCVINSRSRSSI